MSYGAMSQRVVITHDLVHLAPGTPAYVLHSMTTCPHRQSRLSVRGTVGLEPKGAPSFSCETAAGSTLWPIT